MIDDVLSELKSEMTATEESLKRDLGRIRTGRANPSLLEDLLIDYYGTETPLNKLATINAPEARLLVVQPFDQSAAGAIEKSQQCHGDDTVTVFFPSDMQNHLSTLRIFGFTGAPGNFHDPSASVPIRCT